MLVPMFLIIGVFGGKNSVYAAVKFFIYTFAGSVFMLLAILYMVAQYKALTGQLQLRLSRPDAPGLPGGTERLLFAAFTLAFAIKVPMWPVHTWLPDAHTEAPDGRLDDPRGHHAQARHLRLPALQPRVLPAGGALDRADHRPPRVRRASSTAPSRRGVSTTSSASWPTPR
jgi:hypothetical protein